MKLLRVGKPGKEIPAVLDSENKIRDLYLLNKMYKCHIIIYLRRQDKLINSIYSLV